MYVLSLYDVRQLTAFKGIPELELIRKQYDVAILKEAFDIGMDISDGYAYQFHLHRPLTSKEPLMGFVLKGSYRKDAEFRKSAAYTPEAQILSSLRSDVSLTRELCSLSGTSFDYSKMVEEDSEKEREDAANNEKNFDENTILIKTMTELLKVARGSPYNDYGNFKTYDQWISDGK
jgi:hypothetical protein